MKIKYCNFKVMNFVWECSVLGFLVFIMFKLVEIWSYLFREQTDITNRLILMLALGLLGFAFKVKIPLLRNHAVTYYEEEDG